MLLAEALRKIHDSGKVHGAVTPFNLAMTTRGLELLPAPEWTAGAITPYTAPEVLHGRDAGYAQRHLLLRRDSVRDADRSARL